MARWLWPARMGAPRSREQTAELLAGEGRRDEHGFGNWCWLERSGALTGRIGLTQTTTPGRETVELGWAVSRRLWGDGLATEATTGAIAVGLSVAAGLAVEPRSSSSTTVDATGRPRRRTPRT